MTKRQTNFAALLLVAAFAIPTAIAGHQPSNPKKDKRDSAKAALKLQRAVAEKCDSEGQHRGKEFRAVMKEIHGYCGHDLAAGCSIEGKGHSFILRKLTSKKTRASEDSKRYPGSFEKALGKHCKD